MKLIKLEGNLLSSPNKINQISQLLVDQFSSPITIAVSGDSFTENLFKEIAKKSVEEGFNFSDQISVIESKHLALVREILPITNQSPVLSFVKKRFNELEDLCKGIQLLGEAPEKALEEINSIPSKILSYLIYSILSADQKNISYHAIGEQNNIHIIPALYASVSNRSMQSMQSPSYWAVAKYACEVNIPVVEFWNNKNTYYTADPFIVKNAKPITDLSYEEAIELLNYDQHMIDPVALGLLIENKVLVRFLNINQPEIFTEIKNEVSSTKEIIKGISSLDEISLISIEGSGMIGVPGFAKRVFSSLYDANINVILISQGASEHSICIAVKSVNAAHASKQLSQSFEHEIEAGVIKKIKCINDVSIIALVGDNMRSHPGTSGKMFGALGRNGINILAIAQGANEKNISAVIKSADKSKALNVLHESFFEFTKKEINAFVVGTGNVGKKLIQQIEKQFNHIEFAQNIRLNIAGICNSRLMAIQPSGVILSNWEEVLQQGSISDIETFTDEMVKLNLRNSVLIDVTANQIVPETYSKVLKKSMSVVACNKIAASDRYSKYKDLKALALEYNCKFLFETNVGAALPIIGTLNDIIKSGDRIHKMEAVLSGTLNYVFNHYNGERPFAEVVRDAQKEGYTEPDPRLDLSGTDVMRKIMILAREAGHTLEMSDIACNSFLPESCMKGDVENFYNEMQKNESHFKDLLNKANEQNAKLKFVASFENGKAAVGLKHIRPENEMFHLYGKDNIVLFYTDRYFDQPLVIKGAGAGADVTASGVFADILRTINQ